MTFHDKLNVILDSVGHFTSIMVNFTLKSVLRKMTFDVLTMYFRYATSYGKILVIFGFSISDYVHLVTSGRKIKFSIFCQFSSSGTQPCKGLNDSSSDLFVNCSSPFMSSSSFPLLNPIRAGKAQCPPPPQGFCLAVLKRFAVG